MVYDNDADIPGNWYHCRWTIYLSRLAFWSNVMSLQFLKCPTCDDITPFYQAKNGVWVCVCCFNDNKAAGTLPTFTFDALEIIWYVMIIVIVTVAIVVLIHKFTGVY